MVASVRAREHPAVFPNSRQPAPPSLVMLFLRGMMTFQRQAHQQLRAAQSRPPGGSRIQCLGEVVGLSHEMSRSRGRHRISVSLSVRVLHQPDAVIRHGHRHQLAHLRQRGHPLARRCTSCSTSSTARCTDARRRASASRSSASRVAAASAACRMHVETFMPAASEAAATCPTGSGITSTG